MAKTQQDRISQSLNPPMQLIEKNTSDSHQTDPAWMLTFLTWTVPSPKDINNNKGNGTGGATVLDNQVLPVISDCIALTITDDKSNLTGSMQAILKGGNFNYITAISPGDYVLVNIKDHKKDIFDLKQRVIDQKNIKNINGLQDGFKGVFKVQSIREKVSMAEDGSKRLEYHVTAHSFTEFNNFVYFFPQLLEGDAKPTPLESLARLSVAFRNINKNIQSVQTTIAQIIPLFLGSGPSATGKRTKAGGLISPNNYFKVPPKLPELMGLSRAGNIYFSQFFRYLFGVQNFSLSAKPVEHSVFDENKAKEFFPKSKPTKKAGGYEIYETSRAVTGVGLLRPEFFNQVTGWSIMQSYQNDVANEMFTAFKPVVENNRGLILPFVILRQYPFSSPKYKNQPEYTAFLNLPRWVIDPSMVKSIDVGRDDAARINFCQVIGTSYGYGVNQSLIAEQIASNSNFSLDNEDIQRSGLRPSVKSTIFENPELKGNAQNPLAIFWSKLQGDIKIGSHMKLGGSFHCVGIEEPISVGDNLQYGSIVYHIETVTHDCRVLPNGSVVFHTLIGVSHGVDSSSDRDFKVYGKFIRELYQDEFAADTTNSLPAINTEDGDK